MKLQPNHFANVDRATGHVLNTLGVFQDDVIFRKKLLELVKDEDKIHDLHRHLKYLRDTVTTLMQTELV